MGKLMRGGHIASLPSGLHDLGQGIWQSEAPDGPSVRIIAGHPHVRFLDRLYLPVETHLLNEKQVLVINNFRNTIALSDPQFEYNRTIKQLFRHIISNSTGPILEVGPSIDPLVSKDNPDLLLCDVDEEINRLNAERGFRTVHPRNLQQAVTRPFQLIFGCFVFHFALELDEALHLAEAIDPAGVMVFNVVTKSAATRTSAVSQLSRAGLCFQSVELSPTFSKQDILFVGYKNEKSSSFQADVLKILDRLQTTAWPHCDT